MGDASVRISRSALVRRRRGALIAVARNPAENGRGRGRGYHALLQHDTERVRLGRVT